MYFVFIVSSLSLFLISRRIFVSDSPTGCVSIVAFPHARVYCRNFRLSSASPKQLSGKKKSQKSPPPPSKGHSRFSFASFCAEQTLLFFFLSRIASRSSPLRRAHRSISRNRGNEDDSDEETVLKSSIIVQAEYERGYKNFGEKFARGDRM